MTYLPYLVTPTEGPPRGFRNFGHLRPALTYARLLARRRKLAVIVWRRTARGVKRVRSQEPE